MIVGVLLAGGKGSRFKAKKSNKTAAVFHGQPLIQYGVNVYQGVVDRTLIVVGAYKESVQAALTSTKGIGFVEQRKRLGTGHAMKVVIEHLKKSGRKPSVIIVGNGDHMAFYTKKIVQDIISEHVLHGYEVTIVTTVQKNPVGMGRIIRDSKGKVLKIVEEKDATEKERKINEINTGFLCFNYDFLLKNYKKLTKSPASGEYYITEFIQMAISQNKQVNGYKVPFKYVGFGINTREDFAHSLSLFSSK